MTRLRRAWADLLLVDGDPTQNDDLLKDYSPNLVAIKDGTGYENTLPP